MYRKIYHISGLIFPLIIILFSKKEAVYVSGLLLLLILLFDIVRLNWDNFNKWVFDKIGFMFKQDEFKKMSGSPFFLGGVFLALVLFEYQSAIGGIIYLSIGDTAAVSIGESVGKIKIFDKTLEGTVGFLVSSVIAIGAIKVLGVVDFGLLTIFIGGLLCAIVELVPMRIDDNLVIPLIGAAVLKYI
ncbi:MAG: diacylglycerol/polyprenol kinase family protein [Elusimicrobiota bacterium]